ncbi:MULTISPECIES: 2-isopropylmalate synthase [Acinetobacter]|uniref:2-isopropylmalate synthase n=1 Tax=Acinetobacter higginsii TaxID=70347 RepID=N9TC80_9GAMM|nr:MULTISPECIES: 2-isopropylmalate synthase [Acinetobacter]ENV09857.1 2-isopropylmalate synthase [Acinetobacter higginsii]ENX61010.1 2-isopropylmalate synthase [Acinetobacter higginsii]MCH7392566.1 2-isopropylmalate synthase [Acinetobacter dispersus]MCI3880430.1 2-isopropylmalate synthase [Acinetobacter higginsii]MDO3666731.1 2-isopropylmalate synthase [Acinetobacter higginsii]
MMLADPSKKYRRMYQRVDLPDRQWPNNEINQAPIWMSTDLRDGNQAIFEPMDMDQKLKMFHMLVKIGFKHIEIGFPSASQIDFDFTRKLIEENLIPDDVYIEVLVQARDHLIERTFEALVDAKRAIVHIYNSNSPTFRQKVLNVDANGSKQLAINAATKVKEYAAQYPATDWIFQYSPECFSATELEVAKDVCDAVTEIWEASPTNKVILNLPATVEVSTPNVYADQIEWMHRNLARRDGVIISVHCHNDRGCGIAASELAIMAGADRVEGCVFGNGERTGNVDVAAIALNMYTQGVAPNLDFSNINEIIATVEECTGLPVHPRHPYAGDLVFTAFSGSHQDAIKKGFEFQKNEEIWDMPYLPIDPKDLGRDYDAVIRVNSQSGKGGIAYLLESNYNVALPRRVQIEFSQIVQQHTDENGTEISAHEIWTLFENTYVDVKNSHYQTKHYQLSDINGTQIIELDVEIDGEIQRLRGEGNGPISAMLNALQLPIDVVNYEERSISSGANAKALALIELQVKGTGKSAFGAGVHDNIVTSSIEAIIACTNRLIEQGVLTTDQVAAAAV